MLVIAVWSVLANMNCTVLVLWIAAPWTVSNKIQLFYERKCPNSYVGPAWLLLVIIELAKLFIDQYKSTISISGPLNDLLF